VEVVVVGGAVVVNKVVAVVVVAGSVVEVVSEIAVLRVVLRDVVFLVVFGLEQAASSERKRITTTIT
jgi:hypothetical protein